MEEKFELKPHLTRRNLHIAITFAALALGIFLDWNIVEVLIFGVFIWSILEYIPSRLLAIPALFFLSATPFLLILERKERAEEFAIYAYYFLVMTVIMGVREVNNK